MILTQQSSCRMDWNDMLLSFCLYWEGDETKILSWNKDSAVMGIVLFVFPFISNAVTIGNDSPTRSFLNNYGKYCMIL